ncbi:LysR family transcriptional regulator [Chitinimonas sp. PSY-7]|uniref:LysR substrate-binding domain-containing protein n=1 Tax=Chitinimonas sp. PSY-7 TaxID=3459088 RepID=UPI00404023F2
MLLFREVVKRGSFTEAAEALNLTKSGISQHVSRLEQLLGTQLLVRTTRRLSLTEAGRLFAARCDEMSVLLDVARDEIQQLQARPKGPIKVTGPHALASSVVVPALVQLTERFPDLEPDIRVDDAVVDIVRHGIDLAVRVGELADSSLRARKLGELWGVPVASPGYLMRATPIYQVTDFISHAFIATRWQQLNKSLQLIDATQQLHELPMTAKYRVDSAALACELALLGKGIAVLPNVLVKPALERGELLTVLDGVYGERRSVYAVHSYQGEPPMQIQWLQRLLERQLGNFGKLS